jgi:NADPH-dependent curcumin reductase CurA
MSASSRINRQVVLKARPQGIPQAEHFELIETAAPEPAEGQILVRNEFLSVEPAMRGWVNAAANYSEPVPIGGVMRSLAAGQVVASRHPDYRAGDAVCGWFGWQDYAAVPVSAVDTRITDDRIRLSAWLGVLGLNGLTAYFGLLDVGQPKPGETVLVSTAAGSVGSCVGQIAKLMGCRAVGIAGGPVKTAQCTDAFGFDAAIDYKAGNLEAALDAACPEGIDVYFDNTSGAISDAVLSRLRVGARVVICGTASIGNWDPFPQGPRVERHLLVKRARMQGFIVLDYQTRYPQARAALSHWVHEGWIRHQEDILEGLESAPDAIAGLYRGENLGKRLIRVHQD